MCVHSTFRHLKIIKVIILTLPGSPSHAAHMFSSLINVWAEVTLILWKTNIPSVYLSFSLAILPFLSLSVGFKPSLTLGLTENKCENKPSETLWKQLFSWRKLCILRDAIFRQTKRNLGAAVQGDRLFPLSEHRSFIRQWTKYVT